MLFSELVSLIVHLFFAELFLLLMEDYCCTAEEGVQYIFNIHAIYNRKY